MTREQVEQMSDAEIVKEIKSKRMKYAPHWWYKHGMRIRTVCIEDTVAEIYDIPEFSIGKDEVGGGIFWLDNRLIKEEQIMESRRELRRRMEKAAS